MKISICIGRNGLDGTGEGGGGEGFQMPKFSMEGMKRTLHSDIQLELSETLFIISKETFNFVDVVLLPPCFGEEVADSAASHRLQ